MEKKEIFLVFSEPIFDCVWENQLVSEKINYRILMEKLFEHETLMEIKKKKCVLLKDEE